MQRQASRDGAGGGARQRGRIPGDGAEFARTATTVALILEQTLGHITHSANLRALIPEIDGVDPVFLPIAFDPGRRRVPGWSNWTVRAGIRSATELIRLARADPPVTPDVIFVHTQVPAVLLGPWMRRTPTVVSLDATPEQYDSMGELYAHEQGSKLSERLKHRLNERCFNRAAHLVTWSEWARQGLVKDYGIHPDKITSVAPGVDIDLWRRPDDRPSDGDDGVTPVRVLFVGGDLHRKGGNLLIEAVRHLRSEPCLPEVELHLVTNADVAAMPNIVVHRGLTPNDPELIALYHDAHIFCLPTLGDCLPMVLAEAAAASLPIVATDVGAIHEIVQTGVTGARVPPGDLVALVAALRPLTLDPDLRNRCGDAARDLAERDHDARKNAARLVDILVRASHAG